VLDEAIELARRYGSAESGGFVNGVLDQVVRRLRPEEL
jgi:N utilization substance protein B